VVEDERVFMSVGSERPAAKSRSLRRKKIYRGGKGSERLRGSSKGKEKNAHLQHP